MPAGRPKKDRPFAWPVDDGRARLAQSMAWIESASALPDGVREFMLQLFDHAQGLDAARTDRLRRLAGKIEEDATIADSTREYLLMMIEGHDMEDAAGRMQIRTLLGSALIGKPPEAKRAPTMMGRGTPDGKGTTRPTRDALRAIGDEVG